MDAFRQTRTWERAKRLGISQLVCLGRHTVTGVLCAGGRQDVDWSADYRVFSQDRWHVEELFRPIITGVSALLSPTAPFVVAIDDTHLKKTGTKAKGVSWKRDPLSPPFHCNLIRAQRFLQFSAALPACDPPGAARGIPIRFQHVPPVAKPKRSAPPEDWRIYRERRRRENLSTQAVAMIKDLRGELDRDRNCKQRQMILVVDGSYTNKTVIRDLPERTTLIGRINKNAKLFHPVRDNQRLAVGARRRYGPAAPTPEQLRQDDSLPYQQVLGFAAGKVHTFRVKTIAPVLWKKAGANFLLRIVVIAPVGYRLRKGSKLLYRQPSYLACTDANLALEKIVQYYLWRWDIEVNHRDEKQIVGVGQAQVTCEESVDRQPAFAVANYSMLLLAAARAFGIEATHGTLPPPKWRSKIQKRRITTQDLIQQLRSEVWAYALDRLCTQSEDFVTTASASTKSLQLQLPLAPAVLYAASG